MRLGGSSGPKAPVSAESFWLGSSDGYPNQTLSDTKSAKGLSPCYAALLFLDWCFQIEVPHTPQGDTA